MTLIAKLSLYEIPILVGDLLITSARIDQPDETISIPAFQDVNSVLKSLGAGFAVRGMFQKINKLSEKLYVAVAGDGHQIEIFLKRLSIVANDTNLDFDAIDKMIYSIDMCERNNIQATMFISWFDQGADETRFQCIDYRMKRISDDLFGTISVAGSGADDFLRVLEEARENAMHMYGYHKTICKAFSVGLMSALTCLDTVLGGCTMSRWGGGFEVLIYDELSKQFCKIGGIVHLHFKVDINENKTGTITMIPLVLHVFYVDDIMYQHVFDYTPCGENTLRAKRNELLYATPILFQGEIDIEKVRSTMSAMQWKYICCHSFISHRKTIHRLQRLYYKDDGAEGFVFRMEQGDNFFMAIKSTILEQLLSDAQALIESSPHST